MQVPRPCPVALVLCACAQRALLGVSWVWRAPFHLPPVTPSSVSSHTLLPRDPNPRASSCFCAPSVTEGAGVGVGEGSEGSSCGRFASGSSQDVDLTLGPREALRGFKPGSNEVRSTFQRHCGVRTQARTPGGHWGARPSSAQGRQPEGDQLARFTPHLQLGKPLSWAPGSAGHRRV